MSRNIDPLTLRFSRFLNLIHHYIIDAVRHPVEEEIFKRVNEVDESLTGALTTHRKYVQVGNRMMKPPSWWIDDDDATAANFSAMQQLGSSRRR